ncbi:hypothetical protein MLD38_002645 [Melastoma candidum]|uniref:Uncharacterized protein n=1 Tax=Melastoma candidum TaxID=119954 RepID=A0ACB9S1B7_9MYRT|nr:hypothetical protein MLD38_002645 [Melastoma candidum]
MGPMSLFLLLEAAALLSTASVAAITCPNCGSMPVPYPLSTSPTCGDPSYAVICANSTTLLFPSENSTYPIIGINTDNQQITIKPPSFQSSSTCASSDLVHGGILLNNSRPFIITAANTILFFNCSQSILNTPLNCTDASLCHTYLNSNSSTAPSSCNTRGYICCAFRTGGSPTAYSIKAREGGCLAFMSFVNLDWGEPVSQWPRPGVEIQWALPSEPVCKSQNDCDTSSRCTVNVAKDNSTTTRCYCIAGLTWDAVKGVCINNSTCKDPNGCKDRTALIAGLTCGLGAALITSVVSLLLYRRNKRIEEEKKRLIKEREDILNTKGGRGAKYFTGKEIKKATNNLSRDRLLGAGGFGEVYKGTLDDGTLVAIKCAKLGNAKGTDQVLNEVRILGQVNHRSLVRLLGCCVELEQPVLVYEFIERGTLFDHLNDVHLRNQLSWRQRLQIAHDSAVGLAYLHFSAVPPIYHRDVKSSNILLDEKLNAKVSDFGLSRLAQTDMSHISTCAQGTLGYLDPEYYRNFQLTDKSDVYSFGVVLLELLTSQRVISFNRDTDDVNLTVYAQRMLEEENLMSIVDPAIKEKATDIEVETMKALAFLTMGCLDERRQNRPSMKEVAEEIEYIMSVAAAKAVD